MKKSTYLFALALGASTLTFAQVGIGTSTPSSPLDIQADDAAIDLNSEAADGSRDPKINFQLTGTTTFSIGLDDADDDKLKIGVGAPETSTRMTIDGSGNVGIGNTSPTATLDVDGSAIFNESGAAVDFRVEGDAEANLLFVDASADMVGIGTSSPTEKLHIVGTTTGDTPLLKIQTTASGDGDAFIELESNDAGESGITFTNPDNANPNGWALSSGDSWNESLFVWDNDNSTIPFIILHSGNVGIANTSPSVELDVTGDIEYTGTITDVSDRRLKENFSSIDSVLTKIMKIKGLSYNMINDTLKTREYGVIAQDVQAVFPEMVTTVDPENGYLGVAYIQLIPVLLEGMKEQQAIIEAQKKENESQKAEIESLKAEASNATSSSEENASEIEALKAQVQQMLQLLQQQESVSIVK